MQHLREATETKERAKSRKAPHHQKQAEQRGWKGLPHAWGLGGMPGGGFRPCCTARVGWSVAKSWAT